MYIVVYIIIFILYIKKSKMDIIEYYDNILINELPYRGLRRFLRDQQDPYDMEEIAFKKRYRFTQDVVKNLILPMVIQELRKSDNRGQPIPPEVQILVCLRFYATGSMQMVSGDLLNVSQPSASNIIAKVSQLITTNINKFIKFPSEPRIIREQKERFKELGKNGNWPGLANIVGAIDCTHIKILHTPGVQFHEAYRNRKSYFSINVQAVAGPNGQFLDIVARWAGSTHDSRILQLSRLHQKFREGHYSGILVGDSGYPSLPYLLTPVIGPTTPAERRYNFVHSQTRNVVERMFGVWKRRFPCLSTGLRNKLTTVSNVIVSCAILHNLGLSINDPLPEDDDDDASFRPDLNDLMSTSGTVDGFAMRQSIIDLYN